eukprot:CAMPEP_0206292378 /NCGR_PEP_ID=MMETSP0106_2-20121207/3596_1 /ASSEMBLY_ACC=CAM_ASM_000206 /TAXON_ID=81532 /ORGANISM="Acanthoeca-like sp., Strain 10tr" /LENGTH=287 /DNA_ID=CAMNT_0053722951 /DNA_START=63 /DNA_END=925 /DNA_ORIENTATION=-
MVTLVVVLSNRREDGTLKYRWSEAMVPTYTHDALAIFAAFTVNHPARQNRAMHELDPPRPPHATSAYRLLHRPYFVAVAILKLSFDVCATVWASGDGDLTAMQVAIPGLMLLALVSIKHVAMQWLVAADLDIEPVSRRADQKKRVLPLRPGGVAGSGQRHGAVSTGGGVRLGDATRRNDYRVTAQALNLNRHAAELAAGSACDGWQSATFFFSFATRDLRQRLRSHLSHALLCGVAAGRRHSVPHGARYAMCSARTAAQQLPRPPRHLREFSLLASLRLSISTYCRA